MTWTRKHHEFFGLKQGMRQAALNATAYIYRRSKLNESNEFEFDGEEFQKYMERNTGNRYHRTYIPLIISELEEKSQGLLIPLKKYKGNVCRFLVHPISFASENGKSKRELSPAQNPRNPMFSEEHKEREAKQQQQFISKADQLFRELGMKFDQDALVRIWRMSGKSIERVITSIKFMLHRNGEEKRIDRPHGFMIDCLKKRWSEGFDLYYEPELPKFESRMDIEKFVDGLVLRLHHPQASERLQT